MEPSLEKHQPSLWKWAQHSILLLGTMMAIFVALSNTLNWYVVLLFFIFFFCSSAKWTLTPSIFVGIYNWSGALRPISGNHNGTASYSPSVTTNFD